MNERLQVEDPAAHCGRDPQRLLEEIYTQLKAVQQRASMEVGGEDRPGCPAIIGAQRGAQKTQNVAEMTVIEEFRPRPSATIGADDRLVKNPAKTTTAEDRLRYLATYGDRSDQSASKTAEQFLPHYAATAFGGRQAQKSAEEDHRRFYSTADIMDVCTTAAGARSKYLPAIGAERMKKATEVTTAEIHNPAEGAGREEIQATTQTAGTRLELPIVIGQRRAALGHGNTTEAEAAEIAAVLRFMSRTDEERQRLLTTAAAPTPQRVREQMSDVEGSGRSSDVQEIPPPTDGDRRESQRRRSREDPSTPSSDDEDDSSDSGNSDLRRKRSAGGGRKGRKDEDSAGAGDDSRDGQRRRKKPEGIMHSTPKKRRRRNRGRKTSFSRSGDRTPSRHRRHRDIKVDKFDGSTCVEIFINKFEDIADYNDWDENDKLVHLKASLSGSATYLLTESKGLTYEDMKEKLRRRYSTREQQERFKVELRTRKRRPDESLQDLCHDIERLAALAYPETTSEMRDVLGRDAFIDALNNGALEFKVKERETPTLAKAGNDDSAAPAAATTASAN